ncbi:DNA-binding transcriptional regulator YbjK [Geodermatophilus bullaregiensis]|uniref:TetR/AcrR family transcriptional regulator n=1 Tax=Geodermatophilus bullaregiensis TaxID=1564160 RepID=UPI00195AB3D7|nr:TetR family transcriptional regulator [Geodermatophilus bullaregiensis]MBM7806182.1 DNA-binding transcriptional regulator YbjK [Geodermatophilus bullaregiensis]
MSAEPAPEAFGGQAADEPARRARRYDPDRRERLIATALDVIAEHGVAGATHRAIARSADVPLGSTSYHFASIDELLAAAFTVHAEQVAGALEERLRAAPDPEAALDALARHLSEDLLGDERTLVLAVELYVAAARRPELRAVTQDWMVRSRRVLELHFDPVTARELDALVEGLVLHQFLSTDPMTPDQVRHALLRITR